MSEKPDVTYADIGGMAAWHYLQRPAGMELFVRECVEHIFLTIYGIGTMIMEMMVVKNI